MKRLLMLLALIEGGLVMLLETASPIVVAPVLGHSVQIWATMLCLSVGSLAIGYFLGGSLSKKKRNPNFVLSLFIAAAIFILIGWLLLYLQNYLSAELVTSTYSIVLILFLLVLPLLLFGSTTPLIIALLNEEPGGNASLAGSVFSVSTIGGILFSLITGFYLIDLIGVSDTLLFAVLLSAMPVLIYSIRAKNKSLLAFSGIITFIALVLIPGEQSLPENKEFKTLHFSEGITGQLIVLDFKDENIHQRLMQINRMGQTRINLDNNYSMWPYVNYLTSAGSMFPQGSNSLVLGLGGGTLPDQLNHYLGHSVDAVELDGRIIELSDKYFNQLNAKVNKIQDDARRYVKSCTDRYDFIVLDIFNGEIMPSHGLSKEAFEDVAEILRPGGLIAINFNGFLTGKEGLAGRSLIATLHEAGLKVVVFDCGAGKESESARNLLYFAYKQAPDWSKAKVHTIIEGKEYKIGEHLMDLSKLSREDAIIITDDRPVMEYINRYAAAKWRKDYLENFTRKFRKEEGLPLVR